MSISRSLSPREWDHALQRERRLMQRDAAAFGTVKKFLRTPEAARFLQLAPRTLEGWRMKGTGPPWVRLPDSTAVRYDIDALASWAAGR